MKYKNFTEDDIKEFEAMNNDKLELLLNLSKPPLSCLTDSAQEFFREQAVIVSNILESRK